MVLIMIDTVDHPERTPDQSSSARRGTKLAAAARAAGPPLLFGLRLWASVCLSLYVAFWLELDNAFWAGTSAALVCQPHLGASLRKGWFRMIGTLVGATAIVVLTASFPQDRIGFLLSLAIWGGLCALMATLLRNFAAYAASLAGYTAAIIAADELGAIGGANGEAFTLALTRVSEIWIGIVCAGIVLAGTDFGGAPHRLARLLAEVSSEIAKGFSSMLALPGAALSGTQAARRELIRTVIALDPVIDESLGESSRLRYHSPILQDAVDGLFAALAGWRTAAARLIGLPNAMAREDADAILQTIPDQLQSVLRSGEPRPWIVDPVGLRRSCDATVRGLAGMGGVNPSLRLLAEQTARVLAGLSNALEGLALLVTGPAPRQRGRNFRFYVPDWLPALVNGARAFVTIVAVEVFWVVTEWPNGALAISWTAIAGILLAPRADESYALAVKYMVGTGLAAFAAILLLVGLRNVDTFVGFSIILGLYFVPVGTMMAQPWQSAMFAPMAGNLIPFLAPTNQMSYNAAQFFNTALAIVTGCCVAALSFRLIPPLSSSLRSKRLLELTLRDLRRLATKPIGRSEGDWERRMYSRLAAMPDQAEPLQRAQLLAALSVGTEIIQLRRFAFQLKGAAELESALGAVARGNSAAAIARLVELDNRLVDFSDDSPASLLASRARSQLLAVCDALTHHRVYFDRGATVEIRRD
jgi:uncharacterized membrane protein YccC